MSGFERAMAKLDKINERLDTMVERSAPTGDMTNHVWFWMFTVPVVGMTIVAFVLLVDF